MADGSLNKNTGEPRYMALARRLADDIREGKYPINSPHPNGSETDKQIQHQPVHCARSHPAVAIPRSLVIRRQGVGTRVLADYPVRNYMQTRNTVGRSPSVRRQSLLKEMEMSEIKADAILAERLGCPMAKHF